MLKVPKHTKLNLKFNSCPRFLQRYRKMSHHADSGSAASWSRSSTPCPSLAEDGSTNQLAESRPKKQAFPNNLSDIWTLGVCCSSCHTQQETAAEKATRTWVPSSSDTAEGLQSLERVGFSFFLSHTLWASNPNPNDHMAATLAQESTYSHQLFSWWSRWNRNRCSIYRPITSLNQCWGSDCEPITMQDTVPWYMRRNFYILFFPAVRDSLWAAGKETGS